MAEQPSLDGFARKTKRKRNAVSRVPADDCAIAHVMLDVQASHLGRTFDYLVSKDQDDAAQPGAFVRVRFGAQRLTGVIWSRSSNSDTPSSALRFLERVFPSDVLISKSLREDIDAIAKAYGGTIANILRLAVPQRVARVEHEEVFDSIRLHRRKDWCINLKKLLESSNKTYKSNEANETDSSIATFDRMIESYENADILHDALVKKASNADFDGEKIENNNAKSFVVDAPAGSLRMAQDLAWMIVTAVSQGKQAVAVLPTLREVNDVMRALMAYGLKPYKRVSENHRGFSAGGFDGDVARLCAADAPADRYRAWRAVASGIVPCVLGTRAAMYAPVEGDALFAIVEDTAYQYADGMMPYAQARGVMRLRAKKHGGVFVAMAYSRSALSQSEVDSYSSNTQVAKDISGSSVPVTVRKELREKIVPWVRWLNRETLSKLADPSIGARIPHTAVRAINEALADGNPVLLSIAQDGVTQSAMCSSCLHQARCRRCTGPLDISAGIKSLRCLWCGASAVNWSCANCGNTNLRAIRVGAAGIAQEVSKLFRNVPILLSSPHQPNGIIHSIDKKPVIVVATSGAEPRVKSQNGAQSGSYGVVAILDTWVSLYASGLDSRIDTLTAWMKAASLCAPRTSGGSVLLIGETYTILSRALTLWDTTQLSLNELSERKQAVLPPFVTAACVWGERDAVMRALENIGAMKENLGCEISQNDDFSTISPLLGIVPMHPPVTDRYQHFDDFDDRVKAVVRVPLYLRQELVNRLHKEVAHHVAKRAAGELRFCVDPKDLLAY
ncbi:primosomal protein N' [Gardnerella greenwoodii]|uniref:Primosome assembly protein PriA n=1 Tax=Gardnerella greenwoodii 00703Dmash TaxID=698960 RepID=I4M851_9BIFI|nr:primosomal protein N' [Gardnerella greenwoodii]EIK85391.1 primosome assembly protein PriA [Gardnerella greenwoodii 00703Dmash]